MLDGSVPIGIMDSLMMSGIGIFVVFMELILLAVMILIISKVIRGINSKKQAASTPAAVPAPAPIHVQVVVPPAPVAAPALTLTDVDAPTAATIMAVVSHRSGIALNHLAFRSITGMVQLEGIAERDAAVVMALTAHKLQKPMNRLVFKAIRATNAVPPPVAPVKKAAPAKKAVVIPAPAAKTTKKPAAKATIKE